MRVRLAAYGIIMREEQILLAHWRAGKRHGWTLPGGGLDPGEDPVDGALREIHEETGYRAAIEELLGIDSIIIPGEDRLPQPGEAMQAVRIIYRARITGGELRTEVGGSTDDARWFALAELERLRLVPLVAAGLRLLAERPPSGRLS